VPLAGRTAGLAKGWRISLLDMTRRFSRSKTTHPWGFMPGGATPSDEFVKGNGWIFLRITKRGKDFL